MVFGGSDSITASMHRAGFKCSCFSRSSENYFDLGDFHSLTEAQLEEARLTRNILFTTGYLLPKTIVDQSRAETTQSWMINCAGVVKIVEELIAKVDELKIVVIGSESAFKGSYDTSYFLAKAALQRYVQIKKMRTTGQQLIMVSPSTIADAGMTTRRADTANLSTIRDTHPKQRFLQTDEITELLVFLYSSKSNYLTNTNIELNGGKFTLMR